MIISHSKKFIFLHGRKTAGSSIGISLMPFLESGDIVRGYITGGLKEGIYPPDWEKSLYSMRLQDLISLKPRVLAYRRFVKKKYGIHSTHMTAQEVLNYLGQGIWSEYFKFTFERNPFDRIISFYYWRIQKLRKKPTFAEFVDAMYFNDTLFLKNYNLLNFSNLPIYTINGQIVLDYVGQFDNLETDLQSVSSKIGVTLEEPLPLNKSGIRPKNTSYSEFATDDIHKKLLKVFDKEISLFDYSPPH